MSLSNNVFYWQACLIKLSPKLVFSQTRFLGSILSNKPANRKTLFNRLIIYYYEPAGHSNPFRQTLPRGKMNVSDPRLIDFRGRPKRSPSVWSFRDYQCEACGKTFTQNHTMHEHRRFHCAVLGKKSVPKELCPKCGKMMTAKSLYAHLRNKICDKKEPQ